MFFRFADNLIRSVADLDAGVLTRLHTLELRGNKLRTTLGIELPCLKNLFLVSDVNALQIKLQGIDVRRYSFDSRLKTSLGSHTGNLNLTILVL
jgi:hypothetical protein